MIEAPHCAGLLRPNMFAGDAWGGIGQAPEERVLMRRYALGEIGLSAFREQAVRIAS